MVAAADKRTSAATVAALQRQAAAAGQTDADTIRLLEHRYASALEQIATLTQRVQLLEREADIYAARAHARRAYDLHSPPHRNGEGGVGMLTIEGREVVNQTEAARRLNVKQYAVSRWVAAGYFQTIKVGSRTLLFADSLYKPAPKSRKRKS